MLVLALWLFFSPGRYAVGQTMSQEDRKKVEQYEEQIARHQNENNIKKELEYSNKVAFIYWQNNDYDKAEKHFQRCMEINEELSNKNGVKLISYYLGMIYTEKEQYEQALESFNKGLKISRELNLKNSILSGLINLAQTHQMMNNYKQSNQYTKEALSLAKEEDAMQSVRSCYGLLSENYKQLGDSEKSIKYFDMFSSIDKHLKEEQMSEIREKSESQVDQAENEKQIKQKKLEEEVNKRKTTEDSLQEVERINRERQMQLEMQELEIKKKQAQLKVEKTIRNSLIIGFGLITGFSILLFHIYKQKKKAYKKLEEQNQYINTQNKQIQEQKQKLEIQNKKLNDSLNYAQNIQSAILPIRSQLKKEFDIFIFYRPKDIVSGDFYWFTQIYEDGMPKPITFLAVVDCTGHGVPGAFMSMIGNRIFNEIIAEKRIMEPAKILELLNQYIVEALKQETTDNTDGMDVCLISMEHTQNHMKQIRFAGAKRPLYYYSKSEGEIKKIRGNRYSIGGINKNKKEKEFTSSVINLEKGDILYLTTDGIFDQVNNFRKRYNSKRFLKVLNQNADKSLNVQHQEMAMSLDEFKGNSEQRDDITVLGAKII
ncbi:MAG: tetratricopeptide repeat protein [Bacteroidota bacterium]